jgi:hypothetical protein
MHKQLLNNAWRVVVLMMTLSLFPPLTEAKTLAEYWQQVRSGSAGTPTVEDLATAERLFRRLFAGESGLALRREWAELGFELTDTRRGNVPLLILREMGKGAIQSRFSGLGFFVFAVERESTTVLQAPHSFHDVDTADIAFQLMEEGNLRAAAWNTMPASWPAHPQLRPERHPMPSDDYLVAFVRALLTTLPDGRVVQLHSFDPVRMYSSSASHADIILSGYEQRVTRSTGKLGRCLKERFEGNRVRTYPLEVEEMGAVNNPVGKLMTDMDSRGFAHLAMSNIFRDELRTDSDMRKNLSHCLVDSAE